MKVFAQYFDVNLFFQSWFRKKAVSAPVESADVLVPKWTKVKCRLDHPKVRPGLACFIWPFLECFRVSLKRVSWRSSRMSRSLEPDSELSFLCVSSNLSSICVAWVQIPRVWVWALFSGRIYKIYKYLIIVDFRRASISERAKEWKITPRFLFSPIKIRKSTGIQMICVLWPRFCRGLRRPVFQFWSRFNWD